MHAYIQTDRKTDMHIYVVVNTLSKISLKHTGFCFYTIRVLCLFTCKFWILNLKMCIQWYWPRQWDILLKSISVIYMSGFFSYSIIKWNGPNKKYPLVHFSSHVRLLALPPQSSSGNNNQSADIVNQILKSSGQFHVMIGHDDCTSHQHILSHLLPGVVSQWIMSSSILSNVRPEERSERTCILWVKKNYLQHCNQKLKQFRKNLKVL